MLIFPVLGSVADYYNAFLINLTASSTSCFSTNYDNLILARDSAILIIDSNYLGVAVTVLVTLPWLLSFMYSYKRSSEISSFIFGLIFFLAYEIYDAKNSLFILLDLISSVF